MLIIPIRCQTFGCVILEIFWIHDGVRVFGLDESAVSNLFSQLWDPRHMLTQGIADA